MECVKNILFFRTDRIGDFILNLPAIRELKTAYSKANITVVCHPKAEELIKGHPLISEIIPLDTTLPITLSDVWRIFRTLSQKKYELAVVSNPHKYLHLLCYLLRIKIRVGYDRKWGFLLTHKILDKKAQNQKHEVAYNLDLVSQVIPVLNPHMHYALPVTNKDNLSLEKILRDEDISLEKPLIVIHPYTTNPQKQWPIEKMIGLLKKFSEQPLGQIILIGGDIESKKIKEEISLQSPHIFDLSSKLTLKQVSALLKRASLLISNDSGPVHIAASFNTKTIVLFGRKNEGSNPKRWGPIEGPQHIIIVEEDITAISVEKVWKSIQNQLTS